MCRIATRKCRLDSDLRGTSRHLLTMHQMKIPMLSAHRWVYLRSSRPLAMGSAQIVLAHSAARLPAKRLRVKTTSIEPLPKTETETNQDINLAA